MVKSVHIYVDRFFYILLHGSKMQKMHLVKSIAGRFAGECQRSV